MALSTAGGGERGAHRLEVEALEVFELLRNDPQPVGDDVELLHPRQAIRA